MHAEAVDTKTLPFSHNKCIPGTKYVSPDRLFELTIRPPAIPETPPSHHLAELVANLRHAYLYSW